MTCAWLTGLVSVSGLMLMLAVTSVLLVVTVTDEPSPAGMTTAPRAG